jgi:hypothetical protein
VSRITEKACTEHKEHSRTPLVVSLGTAGGIVLGSAVTGWETKTLRTAPQERKVPRDTSSRTHQVVLLLRRQEQWYWETKTQRTAPQERKAPSETSSRTHQVVMLLTRQEQRYLETRTQRIAPRERKAPRETSSRTHQVVLVLSQWEQRY